VRIAVLDGDSLIGRQTINHTAALQAPCRAFGLIDFE